MTATISPMPGTISTTNGNLQVNESVVKPTGWRILVKLPAKQDKTESGIYVPQDRRDINHRFERVVQVVELGQLAYTDTEKFPAGPWCQPGDWVQIGSLEGDPFKIKGYGDDEFRLINDDQVLARVDGPGLVERV